MSDYTGLYTSCMRTLKSHGIPYCGDKVELEIKRNLPGHEIQKSEMRPFQKKACLHSPLKAHLSTNHGMRTILIIL